MLQKLYSQKYLFLMLAPAFLLVLLFNYVPLAGWLLAFNKYQVGRSIWDAQWVGLDNFKMFFAESKDFLYLLKNTLGMNILLILINIPLAMIFAVLLNEIKSRVFLKVIQTVSFFPYFLSYIIIYSITYVFFSPSGGALNELLLQLRISNEGLNILGDKQYAWALAIGLQIWKTLGYGGIMFITSIAAIPQAQYESAIIDGASRLQKIGYITIPYLIPTLVMFMILNVAWIFSSNFELFMLYTNPTNWENMEVLDMYIYKYGLQQLDFSYATAIGIIKSMVSVVLLVGTNKLAKKLSGTSIF